MLHDAISTNSESDYSLTQERRPDLTHDVPEILIHHIRLAVKIKHQLLIHPRKSKYIMVPNSKRATLYCI